MTKPNSLSAEQSEIRSKIIKGAMIWGAIAGLIVLGIIYWALSSQSGGIRWGGALVAGSGVGFTLFRRSVNSGTAGAKCAKCNAAFSISKTDSAKTWVKDDPKEERIEQEDGSILIKTWVDETYDVVDTYTCAKCGDITSKAYQSGSKRDVAETTEYPKSEAKKTDSKGADKQSKATKSVQKTKE